MEKLMHSIDDPIAVFDSGLGGISVLKTLKEVMPLENYIYYGDSLNAPYGSRSREEIIAFSEAIVQHMISRSAKCIIIACNTATSAAAGYLRKKYSDIDIIGMEPAVKPAAMSGDHPRVLVMATPVTIGGDKLKKLVRQYEDRADFMPLPAQEIVNYVENGETDGHISDGFRTYLEELFEPYLSNADRRPDAIVLGCTHFPFIKKTISDMFGGSVEIFDGARGTAMHTRSILKSRKLLKECRDGGADIMSAPGKAGAADAFGRNTEAAGKVIFESSDPDGAALEERLFSL